MYSYRVHSSHTQKMETVSILIQVVNVFILFIMSNLVIESSLSLNPYSGGKCIHIQQSCEWSSLQDCLNPYSGGKCIHILWRKSIPFNGRGVSILIQVVNVFIFKTYLMLKEFDKGLNPYSGGKCIHMVLISYTKETVVTVSILIQVVNVFLYAGDNWEYAPSVMRLNPYSGGKCIPIVEARLIKNGNNVKSQSLFRW